MTQIDDALVERVARSIYESIFADNWVGGEGIEAAQYRQAARAALEAAGLSREALREALEQMVEEKCDYMRLNNLGDPEQQHTIKAARKALALGGDGEER